MREYLKTVHSTKNYVVYKEGEYTVCQSCGVQVARFKTRNGYITFSPKWNYSPTTIRHVQWFLKEVRHWYVDCDTKHLRMYVNGQGGCYVPIVDFIEDVYCVKGDPV